MLISCSSAEKRKTARVGSLRQSNTGILLHSGTRIEVLSVVFNISKDCTAFLFGVKLSIKKETLILKIKAIQSFKTPATLNSTYDITSQKI